MPNISKLKIFFKSQCGFAPLIIVTIIAIVALVGFYVYKYSPLSTNFVTQNNAKKDNPSTPTAGSFKVEYDTLRDKIGIIYAKKESTLQVIDDRGVVITVKIAANTLKKDQTVSITPIKSDQGVGLYSGLSFQPANLKLSQNAEIIFDFTNSKADLPNTENSKKSLFLLDDQKAPLPLFTNTFSTNNKVLAGKLTKTGIIIADLSGGKQLEASKRAFTAKDVGTYSILEAAKIRANYNEKLSGEEKKLFDDATQKITSKKTTPLPILATVVALKKKQLSHYWFVKSAIAEEDLEKRLKEDAVKICASKTEHLSDYIVAEDVAKMLGDNQLAQDCHKMAEKVAEEKVVEFESSSGMTFEQGLSLFAQIRSSLPAKTDLSDRVFKKLKEITLQKLQFQLNNNSVSLNDMFQTVMQSQFMQLDQSLIQKLIDKIRTSLKSEFEKLVKSGCTPEGQVDSLIEQAKFFNFNDLVDEFKIKKPTAIKCPDDGKLFKKPDGKGTPPVVPENSMQPSPKASDQGTVIYPYRMSWNVVGDELYEACYDEYPADPQAYNIIASWCCTTSIYDSRITEDVVPLCQKNSPQAHADKGRNDEDELPIEDPKDHNNGDDELPIEDLGPDNKGDDDELPLEDPGNNSSENSQNDDELPIEPINEGNNSSDNDNSDLPLTLPVVD